MLQIYIHCENSLFRSGEDVKTVIAWVKIILGSSATKDLKQMGLGKDQVGFERYDSLSSFEVKYFDRPAKLGICPSSVLQDPASITSQSKSRHSVL